MRQIPIVEFTNAVARGGAEEHILHLLKGLDRRRFRPYFVCTPELAAKMKADVPEDVELIALDLHQPYQLRSMAKLGAILRKRQTGILHSHMFYSGLCASPVGWASRVPVVLETSHGREAWRKGWKASFFVDRCVSRCVDRYIAVSQANARYLVEEKKLPSGKITVIYPGSDLTRFEANRKAPAGLAESVGIRLDDQVIVFVGRLEAQKGHRVLLDAMPRVLAALPNVKLICVGEGVLREALEAQVRDLNLQEAVRFTGYAGDMRDWLAIAHMTVLPSFYEGLPVTPIESLACGKPVVATAVDGTPEVVVDGKSGLIVPPGDPHRLADAICRMLSDRELAARLARDGHRWVLDNFSVQHMVRRTEQFYLQCWEQRMNKGGVYARDERWAGAAVPAATQKGEK